MQEVTRAHDEWTFITRRTRLPLGRLAFARFFWHYRRMNRSALIEALKRYDAPLRENGATRLFIFGSRARGTHRLDSDLDLFIDYDSAARIPNMFRLMELEQEISKALGVSVTITTRNALHPLMKERIERDAVRVL